MGSLHEGENGEADAAPSITEISTSDDNALRLRNLPDDLDEPDHDMQNYTWLPPAYSTENGGEVLSPSDRSDDNDELTDRIS